MRSTLIILIAVVLLIMLPIWVLAPPLEIESRDDQLFLRASRRLSEPALAGSIAFGNRCAQCHGAMGQGGETAPSLLTRTYATDFRDSPSFHAAVEKGIQAHRQVNAAAMDGSGLNFNELEMMAKFLREMRVVKQEAVEEW